MTICEKNANVITAINAGLVLFCFVGGGDNGGTSK